jgi:hypothetical protein
MTIMGGRRGKKKLAKVARRGLLYVRVKLTGSPTDPSFFRLPPPAGLLIGWQCSELECHRHI